MYVRYRPTEEGEAAVFRVYGSSPRAVLPKWLGECRVTAVGAYCFSDRDRVPEGVRLCFCREPGEKGDGVPQYVADCPETELDGTVRALSGDFLEEAVLPDTVSRIENAAFFGCRSLKMMELGNGALSVGSDVFNNCGQMRCVTVRGSAEEPSGIRHIVSRISWDLEVRFKDAVLLYPEYSENYDTIAPAHIFGLSIEGEGFRARQCFRGGLVDFPAYDAIFDKACATEAVGTLAAMALNRLMTPLQLTQERKRAYEQYLRRHGGEILRELVAHRELGRLSFVCGGGYVDADAVDRAVGQAVREDWSEGAASLMEWRHRYYEVHRKNRYEF